MKAANPAQYGVWLVGDSSNPGKVFEPLKDLRVNFIITNHPKDVIAQLG